MRTTETRISRLQWRLEETGRRWKRWVSSDGGRHRSVMFAPGLAQLSSTTAHLTKVTGDPQTRGIVRGWSARSRRHMRIAFAKIQWPRLQLIFITLTYPRYFTADPDQWRKDRHRFYMAWKRRFGDVYGGWVLEFQKREAPHFHLVMVVPGQRVPMPLLRSWIARTWHEIAGAGDHWCQPACRSDQHHASCFRAHGDHTRCWHFKNAGNKESVKQAHGPLGLMRYLNRELAKAKDGVKAYQKTLPSWLDDPDDPRGAGRWWGVWGFQETTWTEPLEGDEYQILRRAMRKLLERRGVRVYRASKYEWVTLYETTQIQWALSEILWRWIQQMRGTSPPARTRGFTEYARREQILASEQLLWLMADARPDPRVAGAPSSWRRQRVLGRRTWLSKHAGNASASASRRALLRRHPFWARELARMHAHLSRRWGALGAPMAVSLLRAFLAERGLASGRG